MFERREESEFNNAEAQEYKKLYDQFVVLAQGNTPQHTSAQYVAESLKKDIVDRRERGSRCPYTQYNRLLRDGIIMLDPNSSTTDKLEASNRIEKEKTQLPGSPSLAGQIGRGLLIALSIFSLATVITCINIALPPTVLFTGALFVKMAGIMLWSVMALDIVGTTYANVGLFKQCFEKGPAKAVSNFLAAPKEEKPAPTVLRFG